MRAWLVSLLVLVLVSVGAPVQAQTEGPEVPVLQDARGDLQVSTENTHQAIPDSRFQSLDLVGLSVSESEDGFRLAVQLAGLDQPPEAPGFDDAIVMVNLLHNDQEYRAVFVRAIGDQSYYFGYLLKYDPDGNRNFQRLLDIFPDPAKATLATTIARDELLDRSGAAPFPGRQLDGFWASTVLRTSQGFANVNGIDPGSLYNVQDRMPDTGKGEVPLPIRLGLAQLGNAALWSREPIRASNGEQATFVFNVTAQNKGSTQELFHITARNVPADWQVLIPDSYLRIGAGESVHVPVLVSTPFTHAHGTLQKVRLEMTSEDEPGSKGQLDIGIRYFAIPQPGGHHNILSFHTTQFGSQSPLFDVFDVGFAGNSGFAYMNTLDDDPADAKVPITGGFYGYYCSQGCPPEVPHVEWRWDVYLQPSIEMGLDFDLANAGTLDVPIQAQVPIPGAVVGGQLRHLYYDDVRGDWIQTTIANFTAPPIDLMPGQPHVFQYTLPITPSADLLPPAKRAYLGVFLNLTAVKPSLFTGAEAPLLVPGGRMQLPLFEYRDPLQDAFSTLGAVRLVPEGAHERLVNPGKTAVFALKLHNELDEEMAFTTEIAGTHAEWARVLGSPQTVVAGRSQADVRIAVTVPATATDRDAADLIVTAKGVEREDLHGIVRLLARVDLGHTHPDEAAQAQGFDVTEAKDSPSSQAPLLVLGLALLALAARRTRVPK